MTKPENVRLKSCPFCGGHELDLEFFQENDPDERWKVWCDNCRISGPGGSTYDEAKLKWNTRRGK